MWHVALGTLNELTTITNLTGANGDSNVDSGYPTTNMIDITRLRLPSKTTSTTARFGIDLGSQQSIIAIMLVGINFLDLTGLQYSTDSTAWVNFPGTVVLGTAPLDLDDGQYKYLCTTLSPVVARYLRITPSTVFDGSSIYKIGGMAIISELFPLYKNLMLPLRRTLEQTADSQDFIAGGELVGSPSPARIRFGVELDVFTRNSIGRDQLFRIARNPQNKIGVLYDNADNKSCYLVRREASLQVIQERVGREQWLCDFVEIV
jgi:hypothetical protein